MKSLIHKQFFISAAITDAYDGKIARKHNIITKFGIFFDPLADKFLVLSAFYAFMFLPALSTTVKLWMIILISFRDILVNLLRMIIQFKCVTMITSNFGKIKTRAKRGDFFWVFWALFRFYKAETKQKQSIKFAK